MTLGQDALVPTTAMTITDYFSYRSYLGDLLRAPRSTGRRLSVRGLARKLGFSASHLSEILKGTRKLPRSRAATVASRLGLDSVDTEYFHYLVQYEDARSEDDRTHALKRLREMHPTQGIHALDLDSFRIVADWYHNAILELTHTETSNLDSIRVSERLGVSSKTAATALDRLQRLGLLAPDGRGRLRKTHARLRTSSPTPNEALRKFHQQMLAKAKTSIHEQAPDERILAGLTIPFRQDRIVEVEKLTREYFSKVIDLAATDKAEGEVYQLSLQFFRLTQKATEKGG